MTPRRDGYAGNAFATVDFDRPGRQIGFVGFPHSPHGDAWGITRVPLAVLAGAPGPTVVIEGGNHGDEYEGPIVIAELARTLDPAALNGRLILLPAVNLPAVMAASRTSPVDGLNFNRTFPGDPFGSLTQQIAAWVAGRLFPMADAFLDLHSGGSSLDILPSAIIEPAADPALAAANRAAALAFGAPHTVVIPNLGDPRTATAAAVRAGLVTVGTEMRGQGTVSPDALALCRAGVRRVLAHLGVLDPAAAPPAPASEREVLALTGPESYVYADAEGLFEPFHPLGTRVARGEPAGRLHRPWEPEAEARVLRYGTGGILYGRRQPGRAAPGNCCLVVAAPDPGGAA